MDNNDFEIVGRISIDDSGNVHLEATNKALQQVEQEASKLSSAISKLGEVAQYVFGELLVQGALMALNQIRAFVTASVQAAAKHQDIMAQFDAAINSANAAMSKTTDTTARYSKATAGLTTVTVGSTKEIEKTQKALDKAKQSLDMATASYDSHSKHTATSSLALQTHQQKVAALQAQYDKLTKTMQVAITTTDTHKRSIDQNAAAVTMSRDSLLQLADAFSKTTTYSKDMQIQAETTMLQFDRIGKDTFPIAMQAAEDLAARYKIDLSQAAEYVGRALGDPAASVGVLQRQFQLFEPTQLKAIENMAKQGKTAEAQKAILDALSMSISGSATAAANTFTGKMEQFNNRMEEAKIKIGEALIPALTSLMDKLGPLGDKVLPIVSDAFTKLLLPGLGFVITKAGEFLDWALKAGGPIDTVRKAISELVDKGLAVLGQWWAVHGPGITKFITDLGTAIGKIPSTLGGIANDLVLIFQTAFSKIDPAILDAIQQFITKLATGLQAVPGTIASIASNLWLIFQSAFSKIDPSILKSIGDFIVKLADGIRRIPDTITKIASSIMLIFQNVLSKIDPAILKAVNDFFTALGEGIRKIPDTLSTIGSNLYTIVVNVAQQVAPPVLKAISDFITALGDAFRNFPNTLAGLALDIEAVVLTLKGLGVALLEVDPRALGYLATGFAIMAGTLIVIKIPLLISAITAAIAALGTAIIPAVIALAPIMGIFILIGAIVLAAATNFHGFGDRVQELGQTLTKAWSDFQKFFADLKKAVEDAARAYDDLITKIRTFLGLTGPGKGGDRTSMGMPLEGRLPIGGTSLGMAPGQVGIPNLPAMRQGGGPVTRGIPYLVGEGGPELFVPDASGRIVPNQSQHSIVNNYYFGQTVYNPQTEQGQNVAQAFRKA